MESPFIPIDNSWTNIGEYGTTADSFKLFIILRMNMSHYFDFNTTLSVICSLVNLRKSKQSNIKAVRDNLIYLCETNHLFIEKDIIELRASDVFNIKFQSDIPAGFEPLIIDDRIRDLLTIDGQVGSVSLHMMVCLIRKNNYAKKELSEHSDKAVELIKKSCLKVARATWENRLGVSRPLVEKAIVLLEEKKYMVIHNKGKYNSISSQPTYLYRVYFDNYDSMKDETNNKWIYTQANDLNLKGIRSGNWCLFDCNKKFKKVTTNDFEIALVEKANDLRWFVIWRMKKLPREMVCNKLRQVTLIQFRRGNYEVMEDYNFIMTELGYDLDKDIVNQHKNHEREMEEEW